MTARSPSAVDSSSTVGAISAWKSAITPPARIGSLRPTRSMAWMPLVPS